MKFFNKILSAAVIATLAMSVVATSASAHNPRNHKSPGGIFPALFGPVGAAAAVGTSTQTATWFTTKTVFSHYKNVFTGFKSIKTGHKWVKVGFKWKKIPVYKKVPTFKKIAKYKDVKVKHSKSSKSSKNMGKAVVGCVMGSAFGAITASIRKATALGNPPRWRSQAEHERIVASGYEKQFELTSDEAATALALCGLGSFALHWEKKAPAPVVVRARY